MSFDEKAKEKELPITFENPILVKLSYYTTYISSKEIETQLDQLISYLESKAEDNSWGSIFYMYSILLLVDDMFLYYKKYASKISKASLETLEDVEQKDVEGYWLSAWHPKKVTDEKKFKNGIIRSEKLWKEQTKELREALYNFVHLPIYEFNGDYWDILRVTPPDERSVPKQ
ncbi:hypothetical protein WAF17_07830 [Bernardetia sp. ABR2-2B]|uniref:hypothetical protein n=1 Tax=Bernardetia sp. ABR2-2B TaxID=3127472 RepID=UPI0030CC1AD3